MAELRGHVREVLGRPAGDPDPRPQRLPQVGDRVVRGGPAVVRPARQAGQLPARRLPRLRRPRRVRAPGPPAVPARGLGVRPCPRRKKCHVPEDVTFQESWRIAVELLERCRKDLPHAWVGGDDEMGRPAQFRGWLRRHGERYVLDVPCNTNVRDLERRRPRGGVPAGAASGRCRSAAPTPGRRGNRTRGGPG